MAVFWVVAPCSLVEVYQRFRGPYCLHHQGDKDRHLRTHRRKNLRSYLAPIRSAMSVVPSVCLSLSPHVTTRELLNIFLLIFWYCGVLVKLFDTFQIWLRSDSTN
jgi:hypothetical protein